MRACRLAGFSRAAWYRRSRANDPSALRMRIREIAQARPRFGYHRVYILLRREGWRVNLKRLRRWYRLEGLQVRLRVRKQRHRALHRGAVPAPTGLQPRWRMDFVHDPLADGRFVRVLTVVDQWSRLSPILEVVQRVTGEDVATVRDRLSERGGLPRSITVDHGTEFTSQALDAWAYRRGVALDFTRPGKPTDNSHIESFNARLREECLNMHQFQSLAHATAVVEAWRIDYHEQRPHGSLGLLTPAEYAGSCQETSISGAA